ncbi:undecaprenyldiphospho-muramoylpentapeptide beta-N-acetylglucosaminyltransferase [Sulfuriroseicoccus oceanibius]|uniref:UDP-N-acetylglucosamine--N-acetylmuramyl-(pentapeptide) pyrophosphoryl-undecaprenol N-acetylglucosamine transferase n=1 Tax=Sulfuriroseicoccus oceanibius TaxID=2707525 RepID=A0A6B3L3J4_9BACT|nr:undecaprenyldiphospho-muramoylpentapeptide beta-N-acetylglucosaminyltransferase [Sulfuriroseicoccus oceanibius]QQL46069.1 undecaprenyldiphospho-muramoylpentapeptide beta-N-acetylglucosaminyltransferase [Sulfuriroseicoccus oceanibius]
MTRKDSSSPARSGRSVLIACGGTGGHLFPGIAVAQELVARGHRPLLLISGKKIDETASAAYPDLEFLSLPAVGMPKLLSLKFPVFVWKFLKSLGMCRRLIRKRGVSAVLGMGGFTSLPPVMAGNQLKLPTYVHDSNALPGKANRIAARFCNEVFIGMEAAAAHFPNRPAKMVGTPVRDAVRGAAGASDEQRAAARESFGLLPDRVTLLVTGGSQGARALNRGLGEALKDVPDEALQVLWISGASAEAEVREMAGQLAQRVAVLPFCDRMEDALIAADFVLARAGASSLTEFSAVGLPAILVPYPYAAEDHQRVNAEYYTSRGAGEVMDEKDLTPAHLAATLIRWADSDAERAKMGAAMRALGVDSPEAEIADLLVGK